MFHRVSVSVALSAPSYAIKGKSERSNIYNASGLLILKSSRFAAERRDVIIQMAHSTVDAIRYRKPSRRQIDGIHDTQWETIIYL